MFKEINLRNHSSLHKLFYSLGKRDYLTKSFKTEKEAKVWSTTLELQKAKGQAIAQQNTLFKDFYYLFVQTVKVHDVRKATFDNYVKAGKVIDNPVSYTHLTLPTICSV